MAGDTTRLTIQLEVVLRKLSQALQGLNKVQQRLKAISNVKFTVSQTQATKQSTTATRQFITALQRLQQQQAKLTTQQRQLTAATQRYNTVLNRANTIATSYAATLVRVGVAQQAVVRGHRQFTQGQQRITSGTTAQNRVLQATQQRLNSLGAAALRVGGGLRSVGASAAILVTGPLVALGSLAAKSAADIDTIRNRLIATEGSLDAANRRIEELRRLADSSIGVTRRAAFETFSTLSVVGDVTEETINQQIKALGRLNAAFTIDDQQQFFRNLIQIFTQGFERADIKEALGRVPIFEQLLQEAFGTANRDKLRQLKASGKLTLDTFLSGLAEAVSTDPLLSNIGESIRTRFQKTFERLTDALEPLGRAILGPLERIVTAIEPIVLRVAKAFERLPEGVQTAVVVVGLLTAAAGPLLFILGGIASGVGAIATAAAAIIPILTAIGLPGILAILATIGGLLAEITVVVTAFGLAFQKNFLNIRKLTSDAASAVLRAFNRIRAAINESVQRILPTLQSITQKVLGAATEFWKNYGETVVAVIRDSFEFVAGVVVTFTRIFGNFIDLVAKLIDADWRGSWRAFARIIVTALDAIVPLLATLNRAVSRAFGALLVFIVRQGFRLASAATQLAQQFIGSLVIQLILGAPQISNAILIMFLAGLAGLNFTGVATILVRNFIAALRRAAAEEEQRQSTGPTVGVDVGSFSRRRRRKTTTETDEKDDKRLRRELDRLREAQDKLDEVRAEGQLEQLRSRIETEFTATKNGLDRELKVLEDNFDDRLVAVKKYLSDRQDLEEAQINAEIAKELELSSVLFQELNARGRAARAEFQTELKEIAEDPKLTGKAREAAIQTAELKKAAALEKAFSEFKIKHAEANARVVELEKQQKQLTEDRLRFERELNRLIAIRQEELRADLFEEQGRTADAAAIRLKASFTETLRELRIDTTGLGKDLQDALNRVDLSLLQQNLDRLPQPVRDLIDLLDIGIKRAQIAELAQFVDNLSAGLRLDEFRIQNKVLDGLISQREAQAQIVEKQRQYKAQLLDVLKGELKKAELIKDQALILSLQQQIAETERLGVAIDEVGQQINQALFQDLQSGLSGIFSGARKGFEGLRDAAISFGERLLDTLNDIAATSIIEQLRDVFKPDATNTEGTVGGFFSKIFGLKPKESIATTASATLQTGATTAATTLTTGATTAGTSFTSLVTTAGTSFASIVIGAASAVAAALGAGGAAQATGGLGSLLGGAAETGLFPAVPGGLYKFVEGGYPEAVLTTDPKHANRQAAILRAFLKETKGLGGRIKSFAAGGFISPHEAQSMMLSGLRAGPRISNPGIGELAIAGTPSMMRLRQVLVDSRSYRDWITSSEGEQVLVDFLHRKAPVIRNIGGKK